MTQTRDDDGWDAGATYEEFMGRWSRPVACDTSAPFIESARQGLAGQPVTFEVAGVGDLPKRRGGTTQLSPGWH